MYRFSPQVFDVENAERQVVCRILSTGNLRIEVEDSKTSRSRKEKYVIARVKEAELKRTKVKVTRFGGLFWEDLNSLNHSEIFLPIIKFQTIKIKS